MPIIADRGSPLHVRELQAIYCTGIAGLVPRSSAKRQRTRSRTKVFGLISMPKNGERLREFRPPNGLRFYNCVHMSLSRSTTLRAIPLRRMWTPISPCGKSGDVRQEPQFRLVTTMSSSPQSRNLA
jgi:hypothetical protein